MKRVLLCFLLPLAAGIAPHAGAQARLPRAQRADHRALHTGRIHRHHDAQRRAAADARVGKKRRRRQPPRCERHDRYRNRDQGRARRLRAARPHVVVSGDGRRAREAALRSGARHRADRDDRARAHDARGPSVGAGEIREGTRGAREKKSRRAQLRVVGHRRQQSFFRRAVRVRRRHQAHAHSVQRHCAGDDRARLR